MEHTATDSDTSSKHTIHRNRLDDSQPTSTPPSTTTTTTSSFRTSDMTTIPGRIGATSSSSTPSRWIAPSRPSAQVSSILKGGRLSVQKSNTTNSLLQPSSSSIMTTSMTSTGSTNVLTGTTATSTGSHDSGRHDTNSRNNNNNNTPSGTNESLMSSDTRNNNAVISSSPTTESGILTHETATPPVIPPSRTSGHHAHGWARTQFCQYDVMACINCSSPDTDPSSMMTTTATINTNTNNNNMGRKLGPLLLDLRRLNFCSNRSRDNENDAATQPSLFSTTVIAQSRGNPSLGSSIYSTCLTVPSFSTNMPNNGTNGTSTTVPPLIATGLSTGALCIHSFTSSSSSLSSDNATGILPDHYASSIEYYQIPRNNRPATSVAWRPNNVSHVAIGYANSTSSTPITSGTTTNSFQFASNTPEQIPLRRLSQTAGVNMGGTTTGGGLSSNPSIVVDRQYCCFLWDVEHQAPAPIDETTTSSPPIRRTKATPLYKLSHNQGVLCLSWILDEGGGQILAVGGQQRNIQLYDLRISGSTSTPAVQPSPVSAYGHTSGIQGIESDPTRPWHFCTFASTVGEVVKIWDVRRIDSPLSEIKPVGTKNTTATITSAKWSTLSPGQLSILVGGNTLSMYDTLSTVSRPISTVRTSRTITAFTQYPYANLHSHDDSRTSILDCETSHKKRMMLELFPKQIVAVGSDNTVNVVACHRIAPLAVSPRSGQIVHSIGQSLLMGSATEGPASMDRCEPQLHDDISAIILRRAQGSVMGKYSMDIASNIEILTEESLKYNEMSSASTVEQLLRLWKWMQLAEVFCQEDTPNWPAKSLIDGGVAKLLESDNGAQENQNYSDSLGCFTYESPGRRAALASCGWAGMFDLGSVMTDCESGGEYERSAALAIWHGNIGLAVDALERGSTYYSTVSTKKDYHSTTYGETLEHIALSIAGYQVGDLKNSSTSVWRRSCTKLLHRPDLSDSHMSGGIGYLRHILTFLMAIGADDGHKVVLVDTALSLCDRVAFACRFLSNVDMMTFVENCILECKSTGNVEGLTVTGLGTQGINILQSYVDITADIQTAALVTSRVIYPQEWPSERRTVDEWLYSYRTLLNTWQMWQIRAIFDVDRASVQRVAKLRLQQSGGSPNSRSRPIPAQLDARCNYCSAPLGLRRQENPPNQWLSKMKNVLPCCPRCRKPLPRCSICMLSLGVPNPYYELTKDRPRTALPAADDLSTLANLPFAEWFSWCLRCKHGGHAHHLVGWFAKHEVCPVSGCTCRCQFDGIRELQRPSQMTQPVTPPPTQCSESRK